MALECGQLPHLIERRPCGEHMHTEPVLPQAELRSRAIERIENGRLPLAISTHIDAGYGAGSTCVLCDQTISREKIEYDVIDPRTDRSLSFHLACHLEWQRECALRLK